MLFAIARGYTSHDSILVHAGVHARRVFATLRMLVASDGACASYTPAPSLPSYRVHAGVHARRVLAALGTRSQDGPRYDSVHVHAAVHARRALASVGTRRVHTQESKRLCREPKRVETHGGANPPETRRGILPRLGLVGIQSRLGLAGVGDVVGRGFHLEPARSTYELQR
ncbi:hypothetical protein C8R44DRAFT_873763 [Mycena epipterygia]|nr:hypothetical protein C8R44DRAFT_873763 [Mycena epipterygia]